MSQNDQTVAMTILEQLGGRKFTVMTGAKNLMSDKNSLSFKLPANFAKDGVNHVKITLDASDTYTVVFTKMGRAPSYNHKVLRNVSDVYAADLRTLFTAVTGLDTSLGTMGAR